ncbi:hypothetical protein NEISICOT_03487 [Neisseria sicca ATCC 29256]|uniref:Uncharacterized protein n=1 Tax=Neisseria sicca ATCC 29256 TaxID=547045 RepID=C6MAA5_NEISI|nr:hypothetical protein NEISICOT_03487 [Neisseria sicca ATCC 29256]
MQFTLEIRFSDDLFVFALHHPLQPTAPFLSEAFLGKRTKIWVSDDLRVGLPEGKSVLLCLAVC